MQKDKELFDSMRNIVILNSLHFSYPLPILMRVSYNTLIVKQNTSDYYKYTELYSIIVYICIKKSQFLNELYLKVIEFRHIYGKDSNNISH